MIREQENKPPFYLLTGLVIGLVLGLILAAIVWKPSVRDVGPSSLAEPYRQQYRLMTALSYAASGDLNRAQARLALLGDNDAVRALTLQSQEAVADGATQREARALAGLAQDLQAVVNSAQATAAVANTPDPSGEGAATPFDTSEESATYFTEEPQLLCESADAPPTLKVFVFDGNNNPQAGVHLTLSSEEGDVEFTTGQRPEMSPGYAEQALSPNVVYTLSISGEKAKGGIQAAACQTEDGLPAWGSWLLLFHPEE